MRLWGLTPPTPPSHLPELGLFRLPLVLGFSQRRPTLRPTPTPPRPPPTKEYLSAPPTCQSTPDSRLILRSRPIRPNPGTPRRLGDWKYHRQTHPPLPSPDTSPASENIGWFFSTQHPHPPMSLFKKQTGGNRDVQLSHGHIQRIDFAHVLGRGRPVISSNRDVGKVSAPFTTSAIRGVGGGGGVVVTFRLCGLIP